MDEDAVAAGSDDNDEDEDEDDDGDEDEDEEGGDEDSHEESDNTTSASSLVENDADGDTASVDPVFRRRVAEALRVSEIEVKDSEDRDSSIDESETWDDDQMLQVDQQLSEVFRQQANTTKRSDLKRELALGHRSPADFPNRTSNGVATFQKPHP